MTRAMREGKLRQAEFKRAKRALMRDPAEREHDPQSRQSRDRRRQIPAAGRDFRWGRFVLRRNAAHGVDDSAVDEFEPVVRAAIVGPCGQAEREQGAIKKVPGVVPGEWASGPVRAAQSRRKADDQETRVQFAKRGHWRIRPLGIVGPVRGAERGKPGTIRAIGRRANIEGHRRGLPKLTRAILRPVAGAARRTGRGDDRWGAAAGRRDRGRSVGSGGRDR